MSHTSTDHATAGHAKNLVGTSAVVTGGGSGLGLATATALSQRGAAVVVADVHPGSSEAIPGATFVATDVKDPAAVHTAIRAATARAPLRVAVACAGIAHHRKIIGRAGVLDIRDFDNVVQVNLTGSASLLVAAAAAMADNEPVDGDRGVIVLTASIAAYDGGSVAYAASKAGVAGMVLPAAQNLADHAIRVMGIAPGPFETPMLHGLPEVLGRFTARSLHPRRPGSPHEFAELMGHIVDNPMLNAEVVRLDGGLRMA